jgi:hypothetical protein
MQHDSNGTFRSSVIAGVISLLPPEAVSYMGKLITVFVLAVVAECGRRLVTKYWK